MNEIIKELKKLPYAVLVVLCALLIKEHETHNWDNLLNDLKRALKNEK